MLEQNKNLADCVTGVMLRLEIQEKKSDMADKDWSTLPAGTAWLLQLCEPYFGSHRIVRADSAFTSTTAAEKRLVFTGHHEGGN